MLTNKMIKEAALSAGADLCGIAPISRMKGAPDEMNPMLLSPRMKTMIALAFRIPRGVQRGIEEGTQFFQYPSLAYGGINEIFAPAVLYTVGRVIEDEGYEAFVFRNTGGRGSVSDLDGSPGQTFSPDGDEKTGGYAKVSVSSTRRAINYTRQTRADNTAPDLQFSFRFAAVACGLGEIGWSKMLLTPEFGPLQRLAFIFTDAVVDYDEMYNGEPLCKRCMRCVKECPGGCIPDIKANKSIKINIAGKECEWADIDMWRCFAFYTHAGRYYNPFVPKEVWDEKKETSLKLLESPPGKEKATESEWYRAHSEIAGYFPSWNGYNMAKCGGCIRGCISRLEKSGGCLEGKFENPLRNRNKPWRLDR